MPTPQPVRVAVFCSHRSPALRYLLEHDPYRGVRYDIVTCLSSEESFAEEDLVRECGIPVIPHPIRSFCDARGAHLSSVSCRTAYDQATMKRLSWSQPDLIVLDAYLYILSHPILSAYPGRIINVHHSDLLDRAVGGNPRFTGLRAVRDAIFAGATETRATVHLVTEGVDQGPPLLRSWRFPVAPLVQRALEWGATDILKAYAYAHQEWMIRATWGPLVAAALALIADGRLDLARVYDDLGNRWPQPYELDEAGRIHGGSAVEALVVAHLMATAG